MNDEHQASCVCASSMVRVRGMLLLLLVLVLMLLALNLLLLLLLLILFLIAMLLLLLLVLLKLLMLISMLLSWCSLLRLWKRLMEKLQPLLMKRSCSMEKLQNLLVAPSTTSSSTTHSSSPRELELVIVTTPSFLHLHIKHTISSTRIRTTDYHPPCHTTTMAMLRMKKANTCLVPSLSLMLLPAVLPVACWWRVEILLLLRIRIYFLQTGLSVCLCGCMGACGCAAGCATEEWLCDCVIVWQCDCVTVWLCDY